jgi:hypothetical protein
MVRTAGLEPAPPFGEQILSLLRIPFRHVRIPEFIQLLMDIFGSQDRHSHVAYVASNLQAFQPVSNR